MGHDAGLEKSSRVTFSRVKRKFLKILEAEREDEESLSAFWREWVEVVDHDRAVAYMRRFGVEPRTSRVDLHDAYVGWMVLAGRAGRVRSRSWFSRRVAERAGRDRAGQRHWLGVLLRDAAWEGVRAAQILG